MRNGRNGYENELNTDLSNAVKFPGDSKAAVDFYVYFAENVVENLEIGTTTFYFNYNGRAGGICVKADNNNYSAIMTSYNLLRPIVISCRTGLLRVRYTGATDVIY